MSCLLYMLGGAELQLPCHESCLLSRDVMSLGIYMVGGAELRLPSRCTYVRMSCCIHRSHTLSSPCSACPCLVDASIRAILLVLSTLAGKPCALDRTYWRRAMHPTWSPELGPIRPFILTTFQALLRRYTGLGHSSMFQSCTRQWMSRL